MPPTDHDLLWAKLTAVEEKVDQLIRLVKETKRAKRRKGRQPMGFNTDVVAGGGVIPMDTPPVEEADRRGR